METCALSPKAETCSNPWFDKQAYRVQTNFIETDSRTTFSETKQPNIKHGNALYLRSVLRTVQSHLEVLVVVSIGHVGSCLGQPLKKTMDFLSKDITSLKFDNLKVAPGTHRMFHLRP